MRGSGIKGLLAVLAGLLLVTVAACAPGANPEGNSGDDESGEAEQVVRESTGEEAGGQGAGGEVCNVEPPDIQLENATVGFSQSETENNPFRITETDSIESAAQERNVELISTNAQSEAPKQISDIQNMLSQGADILIVAPLNEEGLEPAFDAANQRDVPVFLIDRETAGEPCEDFITFMGSDFVEQGERAAEKLAEITDGETRIAELRGVPGASVTNDRGEGFRSAIEGNSDMEIVASQTGNFVRADGQRVMEQLIQSNPDINAVYAHNDEMALGRSRRSRPPARPPART